MWEALCGKRIKQPVALAVLFVLMFIGGCFFVKANQAKEFEKNDYGVFLNADASSLERFKMYETIVIDAQYFTKRDIELLHQNGTVVYTYLNIGSIENFREYYTTYMLCSGICRTANYKIWDLDCLILGLPLLEKLSRVSNLHRKEQVIVQSPDSHGFIIFRN